MRNTDFDKIIQAKPDDRRGLFLATATRMGTTLQNVEKDFWVCLALDFLFNERQEGDPRLLFKGGTSLSKAYGLISRFSEDIDITVFREDLGQSLEIEDLEGISGKQQRKRLEEVKEACQLFIQNRLLPHFKDHLERLGLMEVVIDPTDHDEQTLLLRYPSVITENAPYVVPSVKIEAGAKSALDPHEVVELHPYVSAEAKGLDLTVNNVTVIRPERTFWDKVIILHGLRRWHDHRGVIKHEGNRVSRHYYDLYKLIQAREILEKAISDAHLAEDAALHARFFFGSKDADLENARRGTFSITPSKEMLAILKRDYEAMSPMIFGDVPGFEGVVDAIAWLQNKINMHQ